MQALRLSQRSSHLGYYAVPTAKQGRFEESINLICREKEPAEDRATMSHRR
jgi:hypothetical protein